MLEEQKNLKKHSINRTLVGFSIITVVFFCNYLGAAAWACLVLAVSLLAFLEFKSLCNNMGIYPIETWINFFITLFIMTPLLVVNSYSPDFVYTTQLTLIIVSYVVIFPRILLKNTYTKFEDLTMSLWAVFQLGLFPSFFTWIRLMDKGFYYTLTMILAVAANDTGSLFVGKYFGTTKLAPSISPGKTVAGSIGGLFSTALAFWGFSILFGFKLNMGFWSPIIDYLFSHFSFINLDNLTSVVLFVLGILMGIVAQVGDLLVSSLKRAAGVKDSGSILLSHGGILDRVDSHIFTVWFAFYIYLYLII